MTLGFMQQWPKEMAMQDNKTYFIEKINLGLLENGLIKRIEYIDSLEEYRSKFGDNWDWKPRLHPKLHTIRKDQNDRWRPGMDIHFVINGRRKDRFQFAPVVKSTSVQSFEIEWINGTAWVKIENRHFTTFKKTEYGYEFGENAKELTKNDGFETVEDFFKYFDQDFRGKLIHWTELKY